MYENYDSDVKDTRYILNTNVNKMLELGYVTKDMYMFKKYNDLLQYILKYDLATVILLTKYTGKPDINCIIGLCNKHLGKDTIPVLLAALLKIKYRKQKRIRINKKVINRNPFTIEEDKFIMTHYIKDSALALNRSISTIKNRRNFLKQQKLLSLQS